MSHLQPIYPCSGYVDPSFINQISFAGNMVMPFIYVSPCFFPSSFRFLWFNKSIISPL